MQKTADLDISLGKHNSDYQLSNTRQATKKWLKMLEKKVMNKSIEKRTMYIHVHKKLSTKTDKNNMRKYLVSDWTEWSFSVV